MPAFFPVFTISAFLNLASAIPVSAKRAAAFLGAFLTMVAALSNGVGLCQTIPPNESRLAEVAAGTVSEGHALWWGFNAEDSTDSLQKALDSGLDKLIIDVPAIDGKTYSWIVRPLAVKSNMEITLDEGVEILAKKGEFLGVGDALLRIVNQKNVILRAAKPRTATLKMRKADYHLPPYKLAEWRHALNIKSSENIIIDGLNLVESGGDGIYLGVATRGVTNKNIIIQNVVCDGNNRQGISVISAENLRIEKTILRNTKGTAPESGIDFEPNCDDEKLANCVMRDCVCENNAGAGIDLYLPNLKKKSGPVGIRLENVISRNNQRASVSLTVSNSEQESLTGAIDIRNCTFENDKGGLFVRSLAENGCSLSVENTTIKNCSIVPDEKRKVYQAPVVFTGRVMDETSFGSVTFNNVQIIDDNCTGLEGKQPFFRFSDASLNGFGLSHFNGSLRWTCCGKTASFELNENLWQKIYPTINLRKIPQKRVEPQNAQPVGAPADCGGERLYSFEKVFSRNGAQIWLYAQAGQTLRFNLLQRPVGKAQPSNAPVLLTSPSGKKSSLPATESQKEVSYCVPAKETGVYLLDVSVGSHAVCLTQCNVPVAYNSQPYRNLVYSVGSMYFWVPEGTKEFAVKVFASDQEQVKATIFAPDGTAEGKRVWQEDNIDTVKMFYSEANQPVPSGVWRIRFDRSSQGVLEDFGFSLVGVPSIPGPAAELLLKAKE